MILALLPVCVLLGAQAPKPMPKDAARVMLFQATPALFKPGQPVELRWVTSGVESVRIEPMDEEQPPLGKMTVVPDGKTVYWIHAYNEHGGESLPVEIEPLRPVKVFAPGETEKPAPVEPSPLPVPAAPALAVTAKAALEPKPAPVTKAPPVQKAAAVSMPVPVAAPVSVPAAAPVAAPTSTLPRLPETAKPVIATRMSKPQVVEAPSRLADLPAIESGTTQPRLASPQSALSKVTPYAPVTAEKGRDVAAQTAPVQTGSAKGIWIQFIALFNAESAQSVKSQLEQNTGHPVTVFQAPSNGQTVNRIRMGPFNSRKEAFSRMREVRAKALSMDLNPQMIFE